MERELAKFDVKSYREPAKFDVKSDQQGVVFTATVPSPYLSENKNGTPKLGQLYIIYTLPAICHKTGERTRFEALHDARADSIDGQFPFVAWRNCVVFSLAHKVELTSMSKSRRTTQTLCEYGPLRSIECACRVAGDDFRKHRDMHEMIGHCAEPFGMLEQSRQQVYLYYKCHFPCCSGPKDAIDLSESEVSLRLFLPPIEQLFISSDFSTPLLKDVEALAATLHTALPPTFCNPLSDIVVGYARPQLCLQDIQVQVYGMILYNNASNIPRTLCL